MERRKINFEVQSLLQLLQSTCAIRIANLRDQSQKQSGNLKSNFVDWGESFVERLCLGENRMVQSCDTANQSDTGTWLIFWGECLIESEKM